MKKLLSAAAVALLATTGVAAAKDVPFTGTGGASFKILGQTVTVSGDYKPTYLFGLVKGSDVLKKQAELGIGFGYGQEGTNDGNIENASATVINTWTLSGTVSPDCSYYSGGGASTGSSHQINFGEIGVNTQAATSVGNAFNMVSAAKATVLSTTAGCNTKNKVSIAKNKDGLINGDTATGYDSNQFQANIPYSVEASFVAGNNTSRTGAGDATVKAGLNDASAIGSFGAWRSAFKLEIEAPAPSKGLLSGTYSDTVTVTIAVDGGNAA